MPLRFNDGWETEISGMLHYDVLLYVDDNKRETIIFKTRFFQNILLCWIHYVWIKV